MEKRNLNEDVIKNAEELKKYKDKERYKKYVEVMEKVKKAEE